MLESQSSDAGKASARISRGAATLLAIAQENDKHGKIADNEALRLALDHLTQLPSLCAQRNRKDMLAALGCSDLPPTWFSFCVSLANAIDTEIEKRSNGKSGNWSLRTDFDRNVYLAIGQSIGGIIRNGRGSLDFPTDKLLGSLSKVPPVRLQQLLIRNYLGNILQELFDSCKVRLKRRGLPEETELNLREKDAHQLAAVLFAEHSENGSAIATDSLLESLKRLLKALRNLPEPRQKSASQ